MIIDGFDAQAVGFVAPIISVAWGVSKASFSPVFAAGLLGMAIGALFFGALADRYGRKAIIRGLLRGVRRADDRQSLRRFDHLAHDSAIHLPASASAVRCPTPSR